MTDTPTTTKHFGTYWWIDTNYSRIRVTIDPEQWVEHGDFNWVSTETTYAGGTLFVMHEPVTGKFHIIEMGGPWDNPWDKEHDGVFESPLSALKAAARILKDDALWGAKQEALIDESFAAAERAEIERTMLTLE